MENRSFMSHEAAVTFRSKENEKLPVLTQREKEVLELVASGLTNQEVAEKLFISNTTVETHRKNLLEKFKAKNVAMMINLAGKQGLL